MVNGLLCAFLAAVAPVAFGFIAPVHTGSFAAMANGHVAHAPFTTATRAMRKESPVMSMERSYIMVKPDGVQRGWVIGARCEQRTVKCYRREVECAWSGSGGVIRSDRARVARRWEFMCCTVSSRGYFQPSSHVPLACPLKVYHEDWDTDYTICSADSWRWCWIGSRHSSHKSRVQILREEGWWVTR